MKITALQGKDKTGKSTTLKLFLKEILEKYSISATEYSLNPIQKTGTISASDILKEIVDENVAQNNPNDVINHTVKFEIENTKIGLTTYGDTKWHLQQALTCLSDCEIIFCACRTKGESIKFLETFNDLNIIGKLYMRSTKKALNQYFIDYTNKKQVETLWEVFYKI